MPSRTTRDYEGPAIAPKVQAALDAALQDEDEIQVDASSFESTAHKKTKARWVALGTCLNKDRWGEREQMCLFITELSGKARVNLGLSASTAQALSLSLNKQPLNLVLN